MGDVGRWPSTQATLIGKICDWRDDTAWKQFVDLYAPLLYRLCRRRQLQDSDAADVVQIVLARVGRAVDQFDRQRGRFRAWLITITSREIYRWRQQRQVRAGEVVQESVEFLQAAMEADWTAEMQVQVFDTALERVREQCDPEAWETFQLVWLESKSPQQVAVELGKNIQWVYRLRRKVLDRLRQEVELLTADALVAAGA